MASEANLGRDSGRCFFETERHIVAQIGAALTASTTPSTATSSSKYIIDAEQIPENVMKFIEDGRVETGRLKSPAIEAGMSKAVVHRTLLRV